MISTIKVVRFYPGEIDLPAPAARYLLTQVLAELAGITGCDLADRWLALRLPANFSKALATCVAGGWISRSPAGIWQATRKARAVSIVLVDEVPDRDPDEADQDFQDRLARWMKDPPRHVLQ